MPPRPISASIAYRSVGGPRVGPGEGSSGRVRPVGSGAGVKFPVAPLKTNATFDYAYTDMKTLGAGHRFSLNIRF